MNPSTSSQHIAVIGGGVIGVRSALYLQRAGFRVTIVDRHGFAPHHQAPPPARQRVAERFPAVGRGGT